MDTKYRYFTYNKNINTYLVTYGFPSEVYKHTTTFNFNDTKIIMRNDLPFDLESFINKDANVNIIDGDRMLIGLDQVVCIDDSWLELDKNIINNNMVIKGDIIEGYNRWYKVIINKQLLNDLGKIIVLSKTIELYPSRDVAQYDIPIFDGVVYLSYSIPKKDKSNIIDLTNPIFLHKYKDTYINNKNFYIHYMDVLLGHI